MNQPDPEPATGHSGRTLNLSDAIAIVVGTIIGAGVFESAPRVAEKTGGALPMMLIWVVGGLLSFAGALCFAEMAGRFRDEVGGDWAYLRGVFGKRLAFLFAWSAFWIVRPGNIAAMSLTFARYAGDMTGDAGMKSGFGAMLCAVACVLLLALVNLGGFRTGTRLLRWLTVIKVAGIVAIALAGIAGPAFVSDKASQTVNATTLTETTDSGAAEAGRESSTDGSRKMDWPALGLALVFVMYAYGGWNDVAFVAAEIRHPEINVLRSLVLGTLAVTVLYVGLNAAFLRTLGFEGMTTSDAVATATVAARLPGSQAGWWASQLTGLLVCVACLSAINAMLITSPRILFAAMVDWPEQARWLAGGLPAVTPGRLGATSPATSRLMSGCLIATALVTALLLWLAAARQDVFAAVVQVSAPFFWFFLGLVPAALVWLRIREGRPAGYRVPLYPLTPLLVMAACGWMTWSAASFAISQELWLPMGGVLALMAAGLAIAFARRRW